MPDDDYLTRLLEKLGLSDFSAETVDVFIRRPLEILIILLAAVVLTRVGTRLARRSVQGLVARSAVRDAPPGSAAGRAETLAGVAASLVRVSVWTVAVLMVVDKLGANLGPLLAGAGILGVALGFGTQSLVKDFVSGFFVLAENQYGVGDVITVVDVTGTVEEVDLRVTRLRSTDGTVWFVPNGEIRKVGNSAKGWSRALVDVPVPAHADVDAVRAMIAEEVNALAQDPEWADAILEPPEVLGVESMGPEGVTVRVWAKTIPGQRAAVARELRARLGARFRREGLVGPQEGATSREAAHDDRGGPPGRP